jgi:hypothetical protein
VGANQFRSIYAVAIEPVAKEYHIGYVPSTLGVSLFLLGFVLGPVLVRLPGSSSTVGWLRQHGLTVVYSLARRQRSSVDVFHSLPDTSSSQSSKYQSPLLRMLKLSCSVASLEASLLRRHWLS